MLVLTFIPYSIGDEIIVTTTDFSMHHTEVRTIKEIVDAHTLKLSGNT